MMAEWSAIRQEEGMKKFLLVLFCAILVSVSTIWAAGNSEVHSKESTRIAVVFGVGGLGDQSFNDNINNAISVAKEDFDFEYDYVEPQAVSEFETFHREFAQTGDYSLIIGAGFDQADAIAKIAKDYPKQHFMLLDSSVDASNVSSVMFKDNESTFLAGYVAAKYSKTGKIGVIGALDIDVINGFIAGYESGARYANPTIQISRAYCGGFADPVTAKEMALQMYNSGVDIIFGAAGGSGLGIFQAAGEVGKYAVGVDSNQNGIKPDAIMMSSIRKFDSVIYSAISDVFTETFKEGLEFVGLKEDAIDLTFDKSNVVVPQAIKNEIAQVKKQIIDGTIIVPSTL